MSYYFNISRSLLGDILAQFDELVLAEDSGNVLERIDAIYAADTGEWYEDDYNLYFCDVCGEYYTGAGFNREQGVCDGCSVDSIQDYHAGHPAGVQFFGADVNHSYSIELEVERTSDATLKYRDVDYIINDIIGFDAVHAELDGSLGAGGFELITQPHDEDAWRDLMPRLREAMEWMQSQGYRSHDGGRCGLHVHFDRRWLTAEQVDRIEVFYNKNWDKLVRLSRRDIDVVRHYADKCDEVDDGDRYRAINRTKGATIEFRLGRGTLNYRTLAAWIDLHLAIVKAAARGVDGTNWYEWTEDVSAATRAWITEREYYALKMDTIAMVE